ncbi:MAG: peptide deformylase [bacterium]|nr:peptide deformylase [bacterium]
MTKIVQQDAPVLRQKAKPVALNEIEGPKIRKALKDMEAALLSQDDGVALAAPQIGISLRIFIVSKLALASRETIRKETETANIMEQKQKAGYLVFINPVLTKLSREKELLEEGCLSVRPLYGKIKRSKKATVTAYDEHGKKFTRGASGLLAQVFQHETDHLDGVLFIDKAIDLHKMPSDAGRNS